MDHWITSSVDPQKKLLETKRQFQQRIQEKEREVQELRKAVESYKSFQFLSVPPGPAGLTSIMLSPNNSFKEVLDSVSQLRVKVKQLCEEESGKISSGVTKIQMILPPEPKTRAELLEYSVDLTMDPNTLYRRLSLSEGNRSVEWVGKDQPYPDHPDRFDYCDQVLSVESLTGRCYWEVQWSGERAVLAVSYRGIRRKGNSEDCRLGYNAQSWGLNCSDDSYTVCHNNNRALIPAPTSPSNRVGVYLDWGSGTLSFYTISPNTHTLTHLHTLTTTFTEPLYAGFFIYFDSSVVVKVTARRQMDAAGQPDVVSNWLQWAVSVRQVWFIFSPRWASARRDAAAPSVTGSSTCGVVRRDAAAPSVTGSSTCGVVRRDAAAPSVTGSSTCGVVRRDTAAPSVTGSSTCGVVRRDTAAPSVTGSSTCGVVRRDAAAPSVTGSSTCGVVRRDAAALFSLLLLGSTPSTSPGRAPDPPCCRHYMDPWICIVI
ncbi:hypothetical protein NFI96_029840 [Prochilodus magdalenae]|nr:hypothetical protein NFI96_029840 [Prochilodus magdalenae]